VRIGTGVDSAADLRDPEPDVVVDEHGVGQAELVPVERTLGLPNHDGFEATPWVAERVEQSCGLGSTLPRQRTGLTDVEELLDDLTGGGFDDLSRARQLPVEGGLRILLILRAHSSVKGEPLSFPRFSGLSFPRFSGRGCSVRWSLSGSSATRTRSWFT
jgi:hypothetical protein